MANTPAYQRIYEDIAGQIRSGELGPASRLMGEAVLAVQYGVARMTVRQAIARLVEESLVVRHQGIGTFVAKEPAGYRSLNRLTSFTEDMTGDGRAPSTIVLAHEIIVPASDIARQLDLGKGAQVIHIARVRRVAGAPKSVHRSYLPYGQFPSLARETLRGGSLYRTLEEVFDVRLRRANQRIRAAAANAEIARHLKVPVGSPVLETERLTLDERNLRIEFARSWTHPELELTVHLER